jgi:branched-chain amino acid transport system substrate-binding protein
MNKRMFSLAVIFSILIMSNLPVSNLHAAEPYKIGAILAVTGRASFLGEPERNTVKMLEESINQSGGINGHPLEIIVYDTEGNETKAVTSVRRLIQQDDVLVIIGPSTSGPGMAILPIINQSEVPNISFGASKKIARPVEDRKWVFKIPPDDDLGVALTYDYMKSKGIGKIGIMTSSTGYGISGREELVKLAPDYGIKIVADETYGPKEADLTAQLTRVRGKGPEAIINYSVGPTQVISVRNWKQLNMQVPLYQSYGFGSKQNIELAGVRRKVL